MAKEYTEKELEYLISDIGSRLEEKKYDEVIKRYNTPLYLLKQNLRQFKRKLFEIKAGYVSLNEAIKEGNITEEQLFEEFTKGGTVLSISDKFQIKVGTLYQFRAQRKKSKKKSVKYGAIIDFFRENMTEILEIDASNDDATFQKMVETLHLMLGIAEKEVRTNIRILREEFYRTKCDEIHKSVKKKSKAPEPVLVPEPVEAPAKPVNHISKAKTIELVTKEDAIYFLKYLEKHSNSQVCKKYGINDKQIKKYKKVAYRLMNITNINDYVGCKNQTEKLAFIEMYSKYGPKYTGEQYGMTAYAASKLKKRYCRELHIDSISIKEG